MRKTEDANGGGPGTLSRTILYDVLDGVATITLNRPDKLNAFNARMMVELIEAFDLTDGADEVRAVIVTGAGRGFCAGADLSGGRSTFDRTNPQALEREEGEGRRPLSRTAAGRVTLRIFNQPEAGDRRRERAGGGGSASPCSCRWTSASPPPTPASVFVFALAWDHA